LVQKPTDKIVNDFASRKMKRLRDLIMR